MTNNLRDEIARRQAKKTSIALRVALEKGGWNVRKGNVAKWVRDVMAVGEEADNTAAALADAVAALEDLSEAGGENSSPRFVISAWREAQERARAALAQIAGRLESK